MIAPELESLMARAVELAQQARGEVEPNPRVGALALADGEVVGRGWHRYWGGPHAEIEALAEARANGAVPDTIVLTLEPCSTPLGEGGKKTPPCTAALIEAGIRTVVVGTADPDPRHRGRGLQQLEAAGIEVHDGVLASACRAMNRPFERWLTLDRPWTIAKYAMTMDGKTAAATGEARWISGRPARVKVHQLRARVDAVVVGFRTAEIDDPELTVRHVDGPQPVRVLVDPDAATDPSRKLLATATEVPTWVLVGPGADPARIARMTDLGAEVIPIKAAEGERRLHLLEGWRELRRRGIQRLMVEGGGALMAQLFSWDCVDQLLAFVAPKIIGGESAPTPVGGAGKPFMAEAWRLDEMTWEACGDDLALRAFVSPHTQA